MHATVSQWTFAMRGINFLGSLPQAARQRIFFLVVVDNFPKWIDAKILAKTIMEAEIMFLWADIFPLFGFPLAIITDNGPQFNNPRIIGFYNRNKVNLKFSSVGRPQNNGQDEVSNCSILRLLKRKLLNGHG